MKNIWQNFSNCLIQETDIGYPLYYSILSPFLSTLGLCKKEGTVNKSLYTIHPVNGILNWPHEFPRGDALWKARFSKGKKRGTQDEWSQLCKSDEGVTYIYIFFKSKKKVQKSGEEVSTQSQSVGSLYSESLHPARTGSPVTLTSSLEV